MASSKLVATTRRSTKAAPPEQPEISRATWAGVALVIAALVGAVALAVFSPSEPQPPAADSAVIVASPSPSAGPIDDRVPTQLPLFVDPASDTRTDEWDVLIRVSVAQDELPVRLLTLEILRGEDVVASKRPRRQGGDVTFDSVRLVEGPNLLTAALRGPGGSLGPRSEPITIQLDLEGPLLRLETPKENSKTTDDTVVVAGTAEPGALVNVRNQSKKWEDSSVAGPAGVFEVPVPLVVGANRILVKATDEAGNNSKVPVTVQRLDGRPVVQLTGPEAIKFASLPTDIRIKVRATDGNKKPIEGADVFFSLIIPGQATQTQDEVTGSTGNATWKAPIPRGGRRQDVVSVTVRVTAPNGEVRTKSMELPYS